MRARCSFCDAPRANPYLAHAWEQAGRETVLPKKKVKKRLKIKLFDKTEKAKIFILLLMLLKGMGMGCRIVIAKGAEGASRPKG